MHGSRRPNCYISLLTWSAMGAALSRNVNSDSWAWYTKDLMTTNICTSARTLVAGPGTQAFNPEIGLTPAGF